MIHHLAAYGKAHRKPKPDAIRKRLAADYALDLCERFGVKTTTARTGKFCLVAAALFGGPDVDLQYHCMRVFLARSLGMDQYQLWPSVVFLAMPAAIGGGVPNHFTRSPVTFAS
jgi:hypothetical protein